MIFLSIQQKITLFVKRKIAAHIAFNNIGRCYGLGRAEHLKRGLVYVIATNIHVQQYQWYCRKTSKSFLREFPTYWQNNHSIYVKVYSVYYEHSSQYILPGGYSLNHQVSSLSSVFCCCGPTLTGWNWSCASSPSSPSACCVTLCLTWTPLSVDSSGWIYPYSRLFSKSSRVCTWNH